MAKRLTKEQREEKEAERRDEIEDIWTEWNESRREKDDADVGMYQAEEKLKAFGIDVDDPPEWLSQW